MNEMNKVRDFFFLMNLEILLCSPLNVASLNLYNIIVTTTLTLFPNDVRTIVRNI